METPTLLKRILNAYSKKKNNWIISYDELLSFVNNLVMNDDSGKYEIFSTNTSDVLTAMLIDMESSGQCGLSYIGEDIDSVINPGYLNQLLASAYENMESKSDIPFPTEQSLGTVIPEERIKTVHIPENLSMALNPPADDEGIIYKFVFSGEILPLLTTGAVVRGRLLVLAVNRIRNYLAYKNNANYAYQKLLPISRNNTRPLVEIIKTVQSNPGRAAASIQKPDEFSFTFWTQLCSFIRKELSGKESMTSVDEGLLHSALLINAYILFYKNIIIKRKQKEAALKQVGEQLKKSPYYFSISDIYSFRDKSGPLLENRYKKEDLHQFIKDKTTLKKNEILPEIIKIKTIANKLYYIHRSALLSLAHKKVSAAHDYYRKIYIDEWVSDLRNLHSRVEMNSDERFHADLEKRIKSEDPLLYALLGYELLFLGIRDSKNTKLKAVVDGWIDTKMHSTRPLPIILNLQRKDLSSEVKSILPFWLSIGFFRKFAMFFRRKKKIKKAEKVPAAVISTNNIPRSTTEKRKTVSRAAEHRKKLDALKTRYDYDSFTVDAKLSALADDWNPLFDYEARNNLVRDVRNMIRDYLRKILRETAFTIPDAERIENIADLLSGNKAFDVIKKREKFKEYIILNIIKILSETKL